MNMKGVQTKEILELIKTGQVSPQQGQELLKKITAVPVPDSESSSGAFSPYKAVVLKRPVKFSGVELVPIKETAPKADEVQIMIQSFGLNFSDLLTIEGMYPNMPPYPFTPGCECSGIIRKKGTDVLGFNVGDEVFCTNNISFGAHASLITVKQEYVFQKPQNISFEGISGMTLVFLVNYHAFSLADVQPGDKVLIHGAAGGVGHIAVQMAKLKGAQVFATCSSTKGKIEFLKKLGADYCIDYNTSDFKKEILTITDGYGVDLVMNILTGENIQKGLDLVAPNGTYIEIAMVGLRMMKHLDLSGFVNNQSFISIDIGRVMKAKPELRRQYIHEMIRMVERGEIVPYVGKIFDFSEIQKAYQYMRDRNHIGKVVVNTNLTQEFIEKELKLAGGGFSDVTNGISGRDEIAIIGMSGRFSGADSLEELWDGLISGKDFVKEIPSDRFDIDKYYDPDLGKMDKFNTKRGGFINQIDEFDALFFNISGYEAAYMEPQQRLFLEEAWKALESAGYGGTDIDTSHVGVYVGCSPGDYQDLLIKEGMDFDAQSFWGTSPAVTAARIAYFLNLKGPAITVDTACSSSLTAIYLACNDIWNGNCSMAVAGGVFLTITPKFYLMGSNAGMLSNEGRCHSLDSRADGFVPGEGVGAVILKPLKKALKDGDMVLGVIKGIQCGQDGRTNGLTAPSALSQEQLIKETYADFHINPEQISYIEAHGTGTKLGDPIEMEALVKAFRNYTKKSDYCAVGSIKSNIGHTSAAAGAASVIKILLAMKHGIIPPTIHFEQINPMIDLESTPFYIARRAVLWGAGQNRMAALSSFGFSGTNVHMVIGEPPVLMDNSAASKEEYYIFPISAKTEQALQMKIEDLYHWMSAHRNMYFLGDISYTLQSRRAHYNCRIVVSAETETEFIDQLSKLALERNRREGLQQEEASKSWEISHMREEDIQRVKVYLNGSQVKWEQSRDRVYKMVPVPLYPLNKEQYWLKPKKKNETEQMDLALSLLTSMKQGDLGVEEAESMMEDFFRNE